MTPTETIATLHTRSKDELILIVSRILKIKGMNNKAKEKILFLTRNLDSKDPEYVNAGNRSINYNSLIKLSESPMLRLAAGLIEGALYDNGKYQTREVMLNALAFIPAPPYYMDEHGLTPGRKKEVGLILSLAGFNRIRAHRPDIGDSRQCWASDPAYVGLTVDQRIDLIYEEINKVLGKPKNKLEELL